MKGCLQNPVDGKHKPQLSTMTSRQMTLSPADCHIRQSVHPGKLIVNIRCGLCGRWGSCVINLAKIDW